MTRSCAENRIEVTENRGIPTLADSEIDHLSVRSTCIVMSQKDVIQPI